MGIRGHTIATGLTKMVEVSSVAAGIKVNGQSLAVRPSIGFVGRHIGKHEAVLAANPDRSLTPNKSLR